MSRLALTRALRPPLPGLICGVEQDTQAIGQGESHRSTMNPHEQEVCAAHVTWIDAVNAGDLDRLLALMTKDAVFISPGQEPFGQDEFAAAFLSAHQRLRIRCSSEVGEVVVVGEVAFTRSRDALSVTPRAGGEATELAGYRMTLYRQQPDGRWLLARDAHTLSTAKK